MLYKNQVFKNYKELCIYLKEDIKEGNSKRAQMKKWNTMFQFHKEGNRIIIDEVYDEPRAVVSRHDSNNHKNMDVYLPYIHNRMKDYVGDYLSSAKIYGDVLQLIDMDVYRLILKKKSEAGLDAEEYKPFMNWSYKVIHLLSKDYDRALERLQKNNQIVFHTAYAFISSPERTRYMGYIEGRDEEIREIETKACNQTNSELSLTRKVEGLRLKHMIMQNGFARKRFKDIFFGNIRRNAQLMRILKQNANQVYSGIDFGSKHYPIQGYCKVWTVTEMEQPPEIDVEQTRRDYIEQLIRRAGESQEKWHKLLFIS